MAKEKITLLVDRIVKSARDDKQAKYAWNEELTGFGFSCLSHWSG